MSSKIFKKMMERINLPELTVKKQKLLFNFIEKALTDYLKFIKAPRELQISTEFKLLVIQLSTFLTFGRIERKSKKQKQGKKGSKKNKKRGGPIKHSGGSRQLVKRTIRNNTNNNRQIMVPTQNRGIVPFGSASVQEKIRRILTGLTMTTYNKFGKLSAYIMVLAFIGVTLYYLTLPTILNLETNYEQIKQITSDIKDGHDVITSLLNSNIKETTLSLMASLLGSLIVGNTGDSIEAQIRVVNAEINLALAKLQKTQLNTTSHVYMLGYCLIFIAYFVYLLYFIYKIPPKKKNNQPMINVGKTQLPALPEVVD